MSLKLGHNWKCPFCGHAQVLDKERLRQIWHKQLVSGWKEGKYPYVFVGSVVCANEACRELTLWVTLGASHKADSDQVGALLKDWMLLPASSAKPQPEVIPKALREDYYEACAIRDLSPKASATITRRCLRGMIRDFCGISKKRLVDEIDELRKRVHAGNAPSGVQPDSVDAIDQVRSIGNIGAHMEADINVIIDVDPDEAQILIELIELLFSEWYIAREARKAGLAKLKQIADEKKQKKQQPQQSEPPPGGA